MKAATREGSERTRSRASRSPGTIGAATTAPVVGAQRLAGFGRRGPLRRVHEHDPLGRRHAERLQGRHVHQGALADPSGQERVVEHGDARDGERLLALAAVARRRPGPRPPPRPRAVER